MSKKRKKATIAGQNRHHLLFQGRHWNAGMAKALRAAFVYRIDEKVHKELHDHVLNDVPKPPPEALKTLYMAFLEQNREIIQLDIINAIEWLIGHCDDAAFQSAMARQRDFLAKRLKK